MIHCQYPVKFGKRSRTEETISREWSENKYSFLFGLVDSRNNYIGLFISEQRIIASMRVQPKHRDLWLADCKIKNERMVHQPYLAEERWHRDLFRYFFKWTVACGNTNTHVFAYHEHKHFFRSCLGLKIFSVPAKMKILRLDIFFVYRGSLSYLLFLDLLQRHF